MADVKSKSYIKETAIILRDKYNGDIPDTIEGLVSLPGVGKLRIALSKTKQAVTESLLFP